MSESEDRRFAAFAEVANRLPGLMYEEDRLRSAHIEPTGVLLPARLNVPYEGPDASDFKATCLGLPVTWSETEQWGLIVALPEAKS